MDSCDRINLYRTNAIQRVGSLVITRATNGRVTHVSNNFSDIEWTAFDTPEEFVGKDFREIFTNKKIWRAVCAIQMQTSSCTHNNYRSKTGMVATDMACTVICRNTHTLFEFVSRDLSDSFLVGPKNAFCVETIAEIEKSADIVQAGAAAIVAIMDFAPYTRGMVYRFLEDWSGEVIYEKKTQDSHKSFAGLRFPASDIPVPARKAYIDERVRIVSDVTEEPVAITGDSATIDLKFCHMRACSPPHLHYLKNIGVRSSLSVAIVVDNMLFVTLGASTGQYERSIPDIQNRIIYELVSRTLSLCVRTFDLEKKRNDQANMRTIVNLSSKFSTMESFVRVSHDKILQVFNAQCILVREGMRKPVGINTFRLKKDDTELLAELAKKHNNTKIVTGHLSPENHQFFSIMWEKTHVVVIKTADRKKVKWAGDPDAKKIVNGKLVPRNSFDVHESFELIKPTKSDMDILIQFSDMIKCFFQREMLSKFQSRSTDTTTEDEKEFFAQMSHELRTPFHGIFSAIQILLEEPDIPRDERMKILELAYSSGESMMTILNDILKTEKMNSNKSKTVLDAVTIDDILSTIGSSLSLFAQKNKVIFEMTSSVKNNFNCVLDLKRLRHVTNNLINNSIKCTQPGGNVSVKVDLSDTLKQVVESLESFRSTYENHTSTDILDANTDSHATDSRKWMIVMVTDTGCGMNRERMKKLLTKPYDIPSTNTRHEGTGLGLYISSVQCREMGGYLTLNSTKGVGTMACVIVPVLVRLCTERPTVTPSPKKTQTTVRRSLIKERTWMVADDNRVNRCLLLHMIKTEHIKAQIPVPEILEADDGLTAVDLFKGHFAKGKAVHVIIIDYHMAGMDGVSATEQIRNLEAKYITSAENTAETNTSAVIYGCTADVTEKTRAKLLLSGMNGVWEKPIPKIALSDLLFSLA
ncbi:FirrV-1-H1 [Feldmannia irregularis virus a]|uniref:histidine kinase n=1 Tax=Feldmannia irregularis virus a TaxID=231992 RepID=Q6XLU9_9PHYC|nr:FirrV-1-H1 [Feldmannia irregularis virus a]AAR26962.1 FirrV-1-H1 [Feldmannia irregularis virus a]